MKLTIKDYLKESGVTAAKLAEDSGLNANYIRLMARGEKKTTKSSRKKLEGAIRDKANKYRKIEII